MNKPRAHGHLRVVGVAGVAVGLTLMVFFPQLPAIAGTALLFGLFHVLGAAVALGSLSTVAPRLVERLTTRGSPQKPDAAGFDFGWSAMATLGPWVVSLAFFAVALGLQLQLPSLWFAWFFVALLGVSSFVGGLLLRGSRSLANAPLPLVDLFAGPEDLILDAGCGGGRTTLAVAKVLPKGRIVSLDRFDAEYIDGGGRALVERNLRIAGITDRVRIEAGDMTRTAFPDAHFDSAVSAHAIDHLGDQKQAGLAEIFRVLKPGGRFLIVAWVPGWVTFTLGNVFCFFLATPAWWRRAASEVGFTIHDEGWFNGLWFVVLERPTVAGAGERGADCNPAK